MQRNFFVCLFLSLLNMQKQFASRSGNLNLQKTKPKDKEVCSLKPNKKMMQHFGGGVRGREHYRHLFAVVICEEE